MSTPFDVEVPDWNFVYVSTLNEMAVIDHELGFHRLFERECPLCVAELIDESEGQE